MAKFGFLSHSDMSIYFFRAPIMRELQRLGHEVFAIAPRGNYTADLEKEFISVNYDLDKASLNPLKVSQNTANLARILKELNLDFLQTSAHKSNVFGTFAAKKAGISRVLNLVEGLGSFYIDTDLKSRMVKFSIEMLYKRAFALSDGCIFVNDADPDYMLSHGLISENKIFRIKSVGVNSEIFDENAHERASLPEITKGKKIVLMSGRALWHKGIAEFYKAAEILKERKDACFVFAGDVFAGNKSSADEAFLRSGNVVWLGWRDDVAALYKACDIFVLPSYKEGFPRTVLEAMSMSRPCVVSDVSGCIEAVSDGVNGLICKARNASDLARKIEMLLDNESLARKMGQAGRKMVVENYDEKIIAKKYIEIYRKFIDV
ncbi:MULTISPECIES: glycosyltransferase family 4 protein [unclassified Campylobacter]|uniref:glycosyltransferase family 4 protein n=1 Tax=unclassified Campylobacter TaxID=2593542 RepID=UPI0022E9F40C|nr:MULTISPECIES: glycosyltransferase family 4 protein [unclassified Campylobacter]MDA3042884.1 glycosyltransferase family 4 protein [Campylobacter sp. JMF_09 ED2]MDA3044281.1 glycosyltransferase family 4 protein [Campylobacter sp. JMF_07 ED4]MDA3063630.1 glycosyltransferase family 4 protein [Campylobacter sp. JMF_11 EL3]MDA3071256.1 glycosyltransferase family 4 protein [Campylobacter sp. VBCF_03 NA9]MDA3074716.1 glycosyltransferase family 4 protein [Campylobacter sp. JMF_05 ED3]